MATTTAKKKGIHFAWFVLIGVLLMMGLCRGGINSGMSYCWIFRCFNSLAF